MRRVRSPPPSSGLAGQLELRVDEHAAFFELLVGIGKERHLPVAAGLLKLARRAPGHAIGGAPPQRTAAQPVDLVRECAERLFLKDRDDALQPREFVRMEVNGIAAWREPGVGQLLEVLAHVPDDGVDDVARREPRRRGRRVNGRWPMDSWSSGSLRYSWLAEL